MFVEKYKILNHFLQKSFQNLVKHVADGVKWKPSEDWVPDEKFSRQGPQTLSGCVRNAWPRISYTCPLRSCTNPLMTDADSDLQFKKQSVFLSYFWYSLSVEILHRIDLTKCLRSAWCCGCAYNKFLRIGMGSVQPGENFAKGECR